jgi:uncharacterized damage-inducible protein DinB
MDAVIKPWVDLWDYLDGNFWHICDWGSQQLTPAELAWQPIPRVASVGWNLQHLAEMLDHYLAHVFHYQPPVRNQLPTMSTGNQDDGRWHDLHAIAGYHLLVRPAYRSFLAGLSANEFELTRQSPRRQNFSWAWAIGHIAEHESYHLGKCTLLRSLLMERRRTATSSRAV